MLKIKVPATSANMGSGFDTAGIALSLYNYVYMEQGDIIDIAPLDNTAVLRSKDNMIYKAVTAVYNECGRDLKGIKIRQKNNIPMTRGLGSSSACLVAGAFGANALLGNPLSQSDLIDLCAKMEGHPDNVTPAVTGGFVTAVTDGAHIRYFKAEVGSELLFYALIPNFKLSTFRTRGILPGKVPMKDAVHNISRSAMLALCFATKDYENLAVATQDRLHQHYRKNLIRDYSAIESAAKQSGALTVYISGSGPTLMAVVRREVQDFPVVMTRLLSQSGIRNWSIQRLQADNTGTTVQQADSFQIKTQTIT